MTALGECFDSENPVPPTGGVNFCHSSCSQKAEHVGQFRCSYMCRCNTCSYFLCGAMLGSSLSPIAVARHGKAALWQALLASRAAARNATQNSKQRMLHQSVMILKQSRGARTARHTDAAGSKDSKKAFLKAPLRRAVAASAGPYTPVKGTVMQTVGDYWEVQLTNGAKGQLRRQHMIKRAQEGDQLTFYILGSSPLGVAGATNS